MPETTTKKQPWFFLYEDVQYNQKSVPCQVSLELSRIFDKVFSREDPIGAESAQILANTKEQTSTLHLIQQQIDTITLTTDFTSPFPVIDVKFTDVNLNTLKYISDGYSKLSFYIKRQEYEKESFDTAPTVAEDFIINANRILKIELSQMDISIMGISTKQMLWQTPFHFAFKNTGSPQPATMILDKYLSAINTALTPKITYTPYDQQNPNMPAQAPKTQSATLLDSYVTPVNSTIKSNVDFLLLLSHNPRTGLYFVKYDELKQRVELVSLNQLYSATSIKAIKPTLCFFLPTDSLGAINITSTTSVDNVNGIIPDKEAIASNLKTYSNIGGILLYDMLSTVNKNEFDTLSRTWKKAPVKDADFVKYFPAEDAINTAIGSSATSTNSIMSFENQVKILPKEVTDLIGTNGMFASETVANSMLSVPLRMDTLFKNLEVVEFTTGGNMDRAVGDLMVLTSTNNSNSEYKRLAGIWVIMRLVSVFTSKNVFLQTIFAIRTAHVTIDEQSFIEENLATTSPGSLL